MSTPFCSFLSYAAGKLMMIDYTVSRGSSCCSGSGAAMAAAAASSSNTDRRLCVHRITSCSAISSAFVAN